MKLSYINLSKQEHVASFPLINLYDFCLEKTVQYKFCTVSRFIDLSIKIVYLCSFLNKKIVRLKSYGRKCKFKMADFCLEW